MATTTTAAKRRTRIVDYPTSDGRPMAETPVHRIVMTDSIAVLDYHFQDDPKVYISGNMMMYYVPGNKRKHVAPDVFAVFGVPKLPLRDYYLIWEEGKGPDMVIESTSKSTVKEDVKKKELYRTLQVKEYYMFDPTADYLDPRLQGFRLARDLYRPIKPVDGRLPSKVLGLHLEAAGLSLRFYNPATNSYLLTPQERAEQEKLRAEQEKLRAEQEMQRAEQETRRADEEKQRADEEKQRADEEKQRADRLALELEQMRRELARHNQ